MNEKTRKRKGAFYTPKFWVDLAHLYIENTYGKDWKDKYIVWDCAWGPGNLTKDYSFKDLYCSTLDKEDIDNNIKNNINPEATRFQFDFLNDPFTKLPQKLQDNINQGKEIIFLINPPYGTSGNAGTNGTSKAGIAKTTIADDMKKDKWSGTNQLYAQFLYRISKIPNNHICIFAKSLYKTGGSYNKFRKEFYKKYSYDKGFLFNAGHFDGTSSTWGVDFSIWKKGEEDRNSLDIDVIEYKDKIERISNKTIYNLDNETKASAWIREEVKGILKVDMPNMNSALIINIKGNKNGLKKGILNSLGALNSNANSLADNATGVFITSSCTSKNSNISIIPENFYKCVSLFTARRSIKQNWINDKDEYLAPNEFHPDYKQFEYDSIVYSLFNNASQQSSLRQVDYKSKVWDIKNEFFWLSKEELMDLALENDYQELYDDAKDSDQRFVYTELYIKEVYDKLSKDAQEVLDRANHLVRVSFPERKALDTKNPEYHLSSWDAGYAQLKLMWKDSFPKEFKDFREAYSSLENRMMPLVYELGFLK